MVTRDDEKMRKINNNQRKKKQKFLRTRNDQKINKNEF